jgi:ABC-type multidrug transport system ATPase subunit
LNSLRLDKAGKKYSREWIFRDLSFEFKLGEPVAITGSNGSGKSTLVKAISGAIPLNEGTVIYDEGRVSDEVFHRYIGISAPYLELIEEFTLAESIDFHARFRPLSMSTGDFMQRIGLEKHANKYIRDFSSGMKQKLKLGFAFFSENEVLVLDEPTANIDHSGFEWYLEEVQKLASSRILLISSNEPKEYAFCTRNLSISDFKP